MRHGMWMVVAVMATLLPGCHNGEFERNPNLKLLKAPNSDQPGDLYYPVWSSNGRIYYFYAKYQRYDLHTINEDGTGDVFLSEWPDQYPPPTLAVSNDGTRLAVLSDSGACIYILDQDGALLDTIMPRYPYTLDVNFTRDDSGVIFQTEYGRHSVGESGFYRRMFNDTAEILIRQVEWNFPCFGFDVFRSYDDSLYIGSSDFEYPRICPGNEDEIVYCEPYLGYPQNFLYLYSLSSGSSTDLNAQPYEKTIFERPYWSPDSKHVVFSAREFVDEENFGSFELWILEDVGGF